MMMKIIRIVFFLGCLFVTNASHSSHKLNHVWSQRELHLEMAKKIRDHQNQCSSLVNTHMQVNNGFGSDIHSWNQAICNAMQYGQTVVQVKERWLWNDEEFCKDPQHQYPLSCYFNIRHECPNSTVEGEIGHRNKFGTCTKYIWDMDSRQAFRLAGTEYLFSNLSTALIAETEKAIVDVFGQDGIPENLISVHMRWGDKRKEMQLVEENEYIAAIENFVSNHTLTEPHVYITTESAEALEKMRQALAQQHPTWKVHYYHQNSRGVVPTGMADQTKGAIGKDSLVSLLLAMEAKYYVITSGSNWSRLIDELRRSVVDVDCGGCTEMVDLRQAWLGNQNWRRHRYRV